MGYTQRERALGHQKGTITTVGIGMPDIREGSDGDFTLRKTAEGLVLFIKNGNIWHDVNGLELTPKADTLRAFPAVDDTPDVSGRNIFNSGGSTETIIDFAGGSVGQVITVISKAAITYDVTSTNLKGGSTDIVTAVNDATTWIYDGSSWYLISWMDVSADLSDGSAGGF